MFQPVNPKTRPAPRDPNRIGRIIELLRQAWHFFPDERLVQLVMNAADTRGPLILLKDEALEENLRKLIASRQASHPTAEPVSP